MVVLFVLHVWGSGEWGLQMLCGTVRVVAANAVPIVLAVVLVDAVSADETGGARVSSSQVCPNPLVGPAEVVVANERRGGLGGWSDIALGVLRDGEGYLFVGVDPFGSGPPTHQVNLVSRGDLADPLRKVVKAAPVSGRPAGYPWAGGGPLFRDAASKTVLQVLHLEQLDSNGHFYSTLHLGRFDPITMVTTYLGPLVQPDIDPDTALGRGWTVDVGASSLTLVDGFLYLYFPDARMDEWGNLAVTSLAVARAPLDDVIAAARSGTVSAWTKYHDGGWESPAWGGPATDIQAGRSSNWAPHVVRKATGGVIMANAVSAREITMSTSVDGITNWSTRLTVANDPDRYNAYAWISGTGDDPSVVHDQFYIYYTQFLDPVPNLARLQLVRRLVTCDALPFSRYILGVDHWETTGPITGGYVKEGTWFLQPTADSPGTAPLYGCSYRGLHGIDHFLSRTANCEGRTVLRTEGYIYTTRPPGPFVALFRCYLPTVDDHFSSTSPECEGAAGAVNEGILGYVRWSLDRR
jgi:hypothetical protein